MALMYVAHTDDGDRRDRSREASECKHGNMTVHSMPKVADRKCRQARVNLPGPTD